MAGFPLLQKDMELNSVGTMLMLQIHPELALTNFNLNLHHIAGLAIQALTALCMLSVGAARVAS